MKQTKLPTSICVFILLFLSSTIQSYTNAQNYCKPTVNVRDTTIGLQWIKFNNSIDLYADSLINEYEDFYDTKKSCIQSGGSYKLDLMMKTGWDQAICVWVDWNKDGVFDNATGNDEKSDSNIYIVANSLYSTMIHVPNGLANGNYRMRIFVDYYDDLYSGNVVLNPCKMGNNAGIYSYGQYFDFKLVVKDTKLDISLTSIEQPLKLNLGNNTIKVKLYNQSFETIDSAKVYYSFNGGSIVSENISNLSLGCELESEYTFSNPLQLNSNVQGCIKSWVKYPNGIDPDSNINNDTANICVCNVMSGIYTLDKTKPTMGSNFSSFTDLASALSSCGVSGSVKINVKTNIYNECIYIGSIPGISAKNNIVIDGGQCVLVSDSFYTLKLSQSQYIQFTNMTIQNNRAYGSATAVHITDASNYITFDNTTIMADTNNYESIALGVMGWHWSLNGNYGSHIKVSKSKIYGGLFSVVINGDSATKSTGNSVVNSSIYNYFWQGFRTIHTDSLVIANNYIKADGNYSNLDNHFSITANRIIATIGWYFQSSTFIQVVNNSIAKHDLSWGLVTIECYGVTYYHNSIYSAAYSSAGILDAYSMMLDIKNNIIHLEGATSSVLLISSSFSIYNCDYNNFYCPNSATQVYLDKSFNKVSDIKGYGGFNKVLYNQPANFVSTNSLSVDLHLNTKVAGIPGDSLVQVFTDIDGDTRCRIGPSMGCDESKYALQKPKSGMIVQDTIYRSTPFGALNIHNTNDGNLYRWGLDQDYDISRELNLSYKITSTGIHQLHLISTNCAGSDTVTKQVVVVLPTTAPVVDFVPSEYKIDALDAIHLYNQTTGGDTAWEWSITQGTNGVDYKFVKGSGLFDYECDIQFITPGLYEVCLVARNVKGDTKKCKSAYIDVLPYIDMCYTVNSKDTKGRFYDEGGKFSNGGYLSSGNCNLLIDPCNGPITMQFKSFNVGNDSYLKIWDGQDTTGKMLHTGRGFTGTSSPGTIVAQSGKLYILWEYFHNFPTSGWEAEWSTKSGTIYNKPKADFSGISNTAYIGTAIEVKVNKPTYGTTYNWLVDGNNQGGQMVYSETFLTAGNHSFCLIATSCGGVDTLCKQVSIIAPTTVPVVDFEAAYKSDIYNCNTNKKYVYVDAGDTIILNDISTQGPTAWSWSSTSSHIDFIGSTSDRSVMILADSTGSYDIELIASNSLGQDTGIKSNYIRAHQNYCIPSSQTINSDIGINEVQMNGRKYTSNSGVDVYTDYSHTKSFCISPGGSYPFTISRNTNNNAINYGIWLDLNRDGIFDASENLNSVSSVITTSWIDTLHIPIGTTEGKLTMRVGASYWKNNLISCGPLSFGEFEDYSVFIVPDFEGPKITLNGKNPDVVARGAVYNDPGATAWDAVDGNVTVSSTGMVYNNINVDSFYISYDAIDVNGNNASTVKRLVYVLPDSIAPIIKLNGDSVMFVDINRVFVDPGAVAYDSVYGNISTVNVTGAVNVNKFGNYMLTYTACDGKNNCAKVNRWVTVGDTTKPEIYLAGANPLTLMVGDTFKDPGVINIVDNYWKNLTYNKQLNLNTLVIGTHQVIYMSTDSSGNTGIAVRTIYVKDTLAPVINLAGGDTIYIEATRNGIYKDPGYSGSDNYFAPLNWNISGNVVIDKYHIGQIQNIIYEASDVSGNKTSKTRSVIVQKTSLPWLTLKGNSFESVMGGAGLNYNDLGVTKYDAFYHDSDLMVNTTGNVDMSQPGMYELKYDIVDAVGNHSINKTSRMVQVVVKGGILVNQLKDDIEIYPNPATTGININIPEGMDITSYQVLDQRGRLIENQQKIAGQHTIYIQTSEFAAGLYLIRINSGLTSVTKIFEVVK